MSDLSSRLENRKMASKDVRICLDPNLLAQRDEAMKAITPPPGQDGRMAQSAKDARTRVTEIEQQIRDASIILRVRGVGYTTYSRWMAECPPRKGRQESYDASKFFMHAAKNSALYVDEDGTEQEITAEEWEELDKRITDGEHDRIAQAVVYVNRSLGNVTPLTDTSQE